MPKQNQAQFNSSINTTQSGQLRIFTKWFASALDEYQYYGRMTLSDNFGISRGESDVIEVPSDDYRNEFVKIGEVAKPLERGSSSFTQLVDQDLVTAWDDILQRNIPFNLQVVVGDTTHPQDISQWRSKYLLENCRITELPRGESANARTGEDNALFEISGSFNYWHNYPIATVGFSDISGTTVTRDLVSVNAKYTDDQRATEVFAFTTNASATSPSAVVYVRTDKLTSISQTDITALSTDGAVGASAIVGSNLLAIRSDATLGHIYSSLADVRSGSDNFTQVTTGYVALKVPNAIYAANVANIFLAADGGYIYRLASVSSNPTVVSAGGVTTQDLNAIHGFGSQVVAVGASSAIMVSNDMGNSWATANAPTAGLTINTVWATAKDTWFIGTSTGVLYFTEDGGTTWEAISLPNGATAIHKIVMYGYNQQQHFGYLIADNGSDVLIYRTDTAGNTWYSDAPYVKNVTNTFTSVAAPTDVAIINQNEVYVTGDTVLAYGINS